MTTRVPPATNICERCGETFLVAGSRAGKSRFYPPASQRFCSRHCQAMKKNGRSKHSAGYVCLWVNGRRVLEHRVIAEQMLGRPLTTAEVVHHINGDRVDNRQENLVVTTQAKHRALVDYLAGLWVKEHLRDDGVVREIIQRFLER